MPLSLALGDGGTVSTEILGTLQSTVTVVDAAGEKRWKPGLRRRRRGALPRRQRALHRLQRRGRPKVSLADGSTAWKAALHR